MRYRRLHIDSMHTFRHGLVAPALLAYFAAAVGVPLPAGAGKDRSVPFPCMDRPCGCHDASGCKQHCCCFTSEQKLAWAARHGVDPTPFVSSSALAAARSAAGPAEAKPAASCCASGPYQPEAPARQHDRLAASPSHCHEPSRTSSSDAIDHPAGSPATAPDGDDDLISIGAYRACHGMAPLWTTLGAALPPPRPLAYEFLWNSPDSLVSPAPAAVSLSFSPPTPPPRG